MKVVILVCAMCMLLANVANADIDHLTIYNADGKCELRKHGADGGYLGTVVKSGVIPAQGTACNVIFTKSEFESTYKFCALSGVAIDTKDFKCHFSEMDNGEYYFLGSPGIRSCRFVCEKN
jgi:hypothetical protein